LPPELQKQLDNKRTEMLTYLEAIIDDAVIAHNAPTEKK
jgi:hypothetical protein